MADRSPFEKGEGPIDYEAIFRAVAKEGPTSGNLPEFPQANSFEEFAIGQHVFYTTFRDAGFTTAEAIYLVAVMMAGVPGPPPAGSEQ
jgi:hypothetical protein